MKFYFSLARNIFILYTEVIVHCQWNAWRAWNTCSKTCDYGRKTRTRSKKRESNGGRPCTGNSEQTIYCNKQECPSGCFPASSTVLLKNGERRKISDLNIGDLVQSVNDNGKLVFSPIILDLDTLPNNTGHFLRIRTYTMQTITLSPGHLIYRKQRKHDKMNEHGIMIQNSICDNMGAKFTEPKISAEEFSTFDVVFASLVTTDDLVLVHNTENELVPSQVVGVEELHLEGIYSPLTTQGNIVIDDVVASCYADFDSHEIQHLMFAPFRLWHETLEIFPSMKNEQEKHESVDPKKSGLHWYAQFMTYVGETLLPWKMSYL